MIIQKLTELARSYLEKNDFGMEHTLRVLDIAKNHLDINHDKENELISALIILHDIGGSSIEDQYKYGPCIAEKLLKQIGFDEENIKIITNIIKTHHERPNTPENLFKILYDADHLVMFSKEEFEHYNSRSGFNWQKRIDELYLKKSKVLAKELLQERRKERGVTNNGNKTNNCN